MPGATNEASNTVVDVVTRKRTAFFLTRPFLLLWFQQLAFFISFMSTTTALPVYAGTLGATSLQIGLISAFFSLAAMLGRLYAGRLSDRGRKIPILAAGAAGFLLISALYAVLSPLSQAVAVPMIALILILRLPYGLAMATSTAGQALTVELAPPSRRGEALNLYGLTSTLATAFFPGIGMAIAAARGYPAMFWFSCAAALAALVLSFLNREPAVSAGRNEPVVRLFNGKVLFPGLVLFCLQFAFGAVATFMPVYAIDRGMSNPGLFFLAFSAAMVISQAVTGRISDRRGRLITIIPGLLLAAAGLAAVAASRGWGFMGAGLLVGLGMGAAQQILVAWAGDLVPHPQRGSAIATMGLFLDGGIAVAALIGGLAAGLIGLQATFAAVSLVPLAGIALAVYTHKRLAASRE